MSDSHKTSGPQHEKSTFGQCNRFYNESLLFIVYYRHIICFYKQGGPVKSPPINSPGARFTKRFKINFILSLNLGLISVKDMSHP